MMKMTFLHDKYYENNEHKGMKIFLQFSVNSSALKKLEKQE